MGESSPDINAGRWHCQVHGHREVGTGKNRHVEYRASCGGFGQSRTLAFRFSEVVRLQKELRQVPELQNDSVPCSPPRVSARSICYGRLDPAFQEERQALLQQFFQELADMLNARYTEVGDFVELCGPLNEFIRVASVANTTGRNFEDDRQLVVSQNAEYEESLQADELRAVAAMERAEQERLQEQVREEERRLNEAEAQAHLENLRKRREEFEKAHPVPGQGEPQVSVRIRGPNGTSILRSFTPSTPVDALFDFTIVGDWDPAITQGFDPAFDLQTSYPTRSLQDLREQTLEEAGLSPSAVLMVHDSSS